MHCVAVGLDDIWQAWPNAPRSNEHLGQIAMVHELVATGDWKALLVPPHGYRPGGHAFIKATKMIGNINAAASATAAAAHKEDADTMKRELFPENIKQALVVKARSRFGQPGEREFDALRITLVERGGVEGPAMWVPLPEAAVANWPKPPLTQAEERGVRSAGRNRYATRETRFAQDGAEGNLELDADAVH